MEAKTYTQEEIQSNINILKHEEDELIRQRKEINSVLRKKRESIKYWSEMDVSQLRIA